MDDSAREPGDPSDIFARCSPSAQEALTLADALRRQYGADAVSTEMVLFGLLQKVDGPAFAIFRAVGIVDPIGALTEAFGWQRRLTKKQAPPKRFTPNATAVLEVARELAVRAPRAPGLRGGRHGVIRGRNIIVGILSTPSSKARMWMQSQLEPRVSFGLIEKLISSWPPDSEFTEGAVRVWLEAHGELPREAQPAARSVVEIRHGGLLSDPSCDLVVLPCSTAGTVSGWVQKIVDSYELDLPPPTMAPGEVTVPKRRAGPAFVFAASVLGDTSDAKIVQSIGETLAGLSDRFARIGVPLLGAGISRSGKERLDFRASYEALRRGFEKGAAPNAVLVILVPERERYDALYVTPPKPSSSAVPVSVSVSVADAPPSSSSQVIAGFSSDSPSGDDLVGIEQDVNTLCAVIAARDVAPPLSIGLFGDWGTGKSFFIGKMKQRLRDLASVARAVPKSESPAAYCAHITQLEFNAWHYIDTENLWASLAEGIIDGLARELQTNKTPAEERARLITAATRSRDVLAEAEQKRLEARAVLDAQQEWLARLRLEKLKPVTGSALRREATLVLVESNEQLRGELSTVAQKLGIGARTLEEKADLLQLRGAARWARAAWRAFVDGTLVPKTRGVILAFVATVLVATAGWLLKESIDGLTATAAGVVAWLVAQGASLLAKLRGPLQAIARIRASYEANVAKIEGTLRAQRDKAQTKVDQAELRVKEAKRELDDIEAQIDALRADKLMARYVRDRHGSDDYRKHLGVIARARADFEQLSRLLVDARSQQPTEEDGLPRIDRIVLYIDDLDRCDERQVVSVLQAVHLLLAFELFVVVVAVDSRWLLHSLRQQSTALAAGVDEADSPDDEMHWHATPMNYLEKIFQVPFALRPMNEAAFARLVEALMPEPAREPTTSRGATDAAVSSPAPAAAPASSTEPAPRPSVNPAEVAPKPPIVAEPPPNASTLRPAIDPRPAQLAVQPHEVAYMKNLGRLIDSPRAAKRFINLYRLLRASVSADRLSAFADDAEKGEYRAAMLLLAIAVGSPDEFTSLRRALCQASEDESWWSWFASFVDDERRRDAPKPLPRDALQRLDEIDRDLGALREPLGTLPPCRVFREWAFRVARFSFNSGTAAEHDAATSAVSRRSLGSGAASSLLD